MGSRLETAQYLELGAESNKHSGRRFRFSENWLTMGVSVKNNDIDVERDLHDLPWPFEDQRFNIVFSSHVLEHLSHPLAALKECRRILTVGGTCRMNLPNARWLAKRYLDGDCGVDHMVEQLRSYDPRLHKAGFDEKKLVELFQAAGFHDVRAVAAGGSRVKLLHDVYFNSRPDRTIYVEGTR